VSADLKPGLRSLLERGVLESYGRGRGTVYIFAPRYWSSAGHTHVSERSLGFDREKVRSVILQRIVANGDRGTRFDEVREGLPATLSRDQIQTLLKELKEQGSIFVEGATRASKWYVRADKTQSDANQPEEGG
jgi:ATP-dependent DNA helicase RecG